jgi:hypothetical protein
MGAYKFTDEAWAFWGEIPLSPPVEQKLSRFIKVKPDKEKKWQSQNFHYVNY